MFRVSTIYLHANISFYVVSYMLISVILCLENNDVTLRFVLKQTETYEGFLPVSVDRQRSLCMFAFVVCFNVNEESPRIFGVRNYCLICIFICEMACKHEFRFAHRDTCEISVYASFSYISLIFYTFHLVHVLGNYYVQSMC